MIVFNFRLISLLAILSQHLGMGAANTVRNLGLNSLPAFIVITKVRSTPEILTVIPGKYTYLDHLLIL